METQCDLSTVMKVSGNLSHMSGDHLHTPGQHGVELTAS